MCLAFFKYSYSVHEVLHLNLQCQRFNSLGGEVVRLLKGDGSGETLEMLEIVVMDTSRRAGGCFVLWPRSALLDSILILILQLDFDFDSDSLT